METISPETQDDISFQVEKIINELNLSDEIIKRHRGEARSIWEKTYTKYKEALESENSSRRWFWELLQNAVDTLENKNDKISIKVKIRKNDSEDNDCFKKLEFEHTGGTFKPSKDIDELDDFENFFRPGSGKQFSGTENGGRFGTGFLSTHCLSPIIKVEGICEDLNGNKFYSETTLDRSEILKEDELSIKSNKIRIISSLHNYEQSKSDNREITEKPVARFTYFIPDDEKYKETLKTGLEAILFMVPYVFAFNNEIEKIEIDDCGYITEIINQGFEKTINNIELYRTDVKIGNHNSVKRIIALKKSDQNDIQIAWRVNIANNCLQFCDERNRYKKKFKSNLTTLFCRYPLVGSDAFNYPIIVNSKDFRPLEKRHGINLKEKDKRNQELLEKGNKLFQTFISTVSVDSEFLYNILNTKYTTHHNHEWIDYVFYDKLIKDLRDVILKTNVIDISFNKQDRKSIIDEANNSNIYFPYEDFSQTEIPERNFSNFYKYVSELYKNSIPIESHINNWLNILWEDDAIKKVGVIEFIKTISNSKSLSQFSQQLKSIEINEENTNHIELETIKWLNEFYNFIVIDFNQTTLLNLTEGKDEFPIIPARSGDFSLFKNLKKDVGFEEMEIDDELLSIHEEFYTDSNKKYKDKLLKKSFTELERLKKEDFITEESIADEIIKKLEEFIELHSKYIKKTESGETLKEDEIKEKQNIERKLSKLQNWISKHNLKRNYFKNSHKKNILQTIIDEKESENLTHLLELNRTGKVSLERQKEIVSDPDLDEKLVYGKKYLESIREKEERDSKNRKIGDHFEKLFIGLLDNEIGRAQYEHKDGKQDFIIYPNTNREFYIELKSVSINKDSVLLTPDQGKNYGEKGERFFVCVVPFSGDFADFNEDDFKLKASFNNKLSNIFKQKTDNISEFTTLEDDVKGVFPDSLLEDFNEKSFKYELRKESWKGLDYNMFINLLKSNN